MVHKWHDAVYIRLVWKNAEHAERLFMRIFEEVLGIFISEKEDAKVPFAAAFEAIVEDYDASDMQNID